MVLPALIIIEKGVLDMNIHRRFIALSMILCLALSFALAGGSGESADSAGGDGGTRIRVGTMPNHIGVPIQYALVNGMYEEAGLDVELILFPTGAPINEALAAEQIDLAGTGGAGVFALAAGDCYWLGDYVRTSDGLGVYVRPDSPILDYQVLPDKPEVYGSKETVEGITILGSLGTTDQFEAVCWAQCFGLTGNDIFILNMDRGPAVQAFKMGEGDAIACGGPPYNFELEAAGFVEVADITDVSGVTIDDGMIGRKEFVDNNEEAVRKFVEVTYEVVDLFAENDEILYEFGLNFYNENGKDYSGDMMQQELDSKDYIGKAEMSKPEYRFGSAMVGMGDFYVLDGKIEAEMLPNVAASMRPDFLEGIYGLDLTVYSE